LQPEAATVPINAIATKKLLVNRMISSSPVPR